MAVSELADETVTAFIRGEPDGIRQIYAAYAGPVTTVAESILRDAQHVEEAVQQTFMNAWRAAQTFDPSRELGPWLYSIARRASIDIYRREQRRAADPIEDHEPAVTPLSLERTWEAWEVRQALDQLPEDERAVMRLSHFEGRSHAQIAELLGIAVGTVKSRSHRAHRRLAAALAHLRADQ